YIGCAVISTIHLLPISALFPYSTLFRSLPRIFVLSPEHLQAGGNTVAARPPQQAAPVSRPAARTTERDTGAPEAGWWEEFLAGRSEEHTSELQSRENLVCRLLLEKKKTR